MYERIKKYKVPSFNKITGYLKPGIYEITLNELYSHKILCGTSARKSLIQSLEHACNTYWSYGIAEIFINGSFATTTPFPIDIDGYICFENENDLKLKQLKESQSIWGNFNPVKIGNNQKFLMWHENKIEFYPQIGRLGEFFYFFTLSRDGIERGIIKIIH